MLMSLGSLFVRRPNLVTCSLESSEFSTFILISIWTFKLSGEQKYHVKIKHKVGLHKKVAHKRDPEVGGGAF